MAKLRLDMSCKAIGRIERGGRRGAHVRGAVVEEEPHDLVCDKDPFVNVFEEAFRGMSKTSSALLQSCSIQVAADATRSDTEIQALKKVVKSILASCSRPIIRVNCAKNGLKAEDFQVRNALCDRHLLRVDDVAQL